MIFYRNQGENIIKSEENKEHTTFYSYDEALAQVAEKRMSKLKPEAAKFLLKRCLKKNGEKYSFTTDSRIKSEIKPAMTAEIIIDQIKQIKCPVLLILANNSEQFSLLNSSGFFSSALEILKQNNSSSRVIRIVGNHCVHNNQPEIIAPIICNFLSEIKSKY